MKQDTRGQRTVGRLAESCGVRRENVILLRDGQPLTILPHEFCLETPVAVECTLVDGKGVGDAFVFHHIKRTGARFSIALAEAERNMTDEWGGRPAEKYF